MNTKNKQSFSFRKVCAFFSIFGFIASLVVHVFSLLGFSLFNVFAGFLYIGALLAILLMVIFVLNVAGGEIWKREFFTERLSTVIPKKMWFVVLGFFVYMVFYSIWLEVVKPNGSPTLRDKKYVLLSEGRTDYQRVIRELTQAEYEALNTKDMTELSGYKMFFYLVPALYFWFSIKKAKSK